MPGLMPSINRMFASLVDPAATSYTILPSLAAATLLTGGKSYAYGAWAQIAATVGAADIWLVEIDVDEMPADDFNVQVGVGTAPAGTAIATLPGPGGDVSLYQFAMPLPIKILGGSGLVGRCANASAAVFNTCRVRCIFAGGI